MFKNVQSDHGCSRGTRQIDWPISAKRVLACIAKKKLFYQFPAAVGLTVACTTSCTVVFLKHAKHWYKAGIPFLLFRLIYGTPLKNSLNALDRLI